MAGIRMHLNDSIHFITNRCEQEQFLMLPSQTINQLIGAWFARSLCLFGDGLEIFAFIFLGNHFHLLCRDTKGALAQFLGYFQGNLARAVNKELGRHGKFFSREYDDVIVSGEKEFLNRYVYILCNAVKAGLVERAEQWMGWSSLQAAIDGTAYRFELLNATKYYKARRFGKKANRADFVETWEFELTAPPMWEGKSAKQRARHIEELVGAAQRQYAIERQGKPVLGIKGIKRQKPTDRPKSPARKPRIKFMCFDKAELGELLDGYRQFVGGYREIMGAFHKAAQDRRRPPVEWPVGSYPPSCIRPIGCARAA